MTNISHVAGFAIASTHNSGLTIKSKVFFFKSQRKSEILARTFRNLTKIIQTPFLKIENLHFLNIK